MLLRALGPFVMMAWLAPPAAGFAQTASDADLERAATARAQAVVVGGGSAALTAEIADELADLGRYEDTRLVGKFGPALKNFPQEAAAAFRLVDFEVQFNLLFWNWDRFRFSAMIPVLKALYQSPPDESAKLRDMALRRLHDLAPDEARPLMLSELGRNELRVSMTTLAVLPDRAFPAFDEVWLRGLANGVLDERIDAAVRLERFGSAAILADVKRVYAAGGPSWSCDVRAAALGYLAKHDPGPTAALVRQAAAGPPEDSCRDEIAKAPILRPLLPPK